MREQIVRTKAGTHIDIIDNGVTRLFNKLAQFGGELTPVLNEIGAALKTSTELRFRDSAGPGGVKWAPLSPVTIALRRKGGGSGAAKPLLDTGRLANSFSFRVSGKTVEVGTNVEYATTHQFGARMGEFGRYSQIGRVRKYGLGTFKGSAGTKKGFPIPWGNIPARPFMGIDQNDIDEVRDILTNAIKRATA